MEYSLVVLVCLVATTSAQTDCGNTVYNGPHGYVTSPNHPSNYEDNLDCSNIIYAQQPSHYYLMFHFIEIEACGECTCDWVEISCIGNNLSEKYRYCGDTEDALDFYQCTEVLVWFYSNDVTNRRGFNLEYNITQEPAISTVPLSSTTSTSQTIQTSTPLVTTIDSEVTSADTTTLVPTTLPSSTRPTTVQSEVTTTMDDTTSIEQTTPSEPVTTNPPETTIKSVPETTSLSQTTYPAPVTTVPPETTGEPITTVGMQTTQPPPVTTIPTVKETTSLLVTTVKTETTQQLPTTAVQPDTTRNEPDTTEFEQTTSTTSELDTTEFKQTTPIPVDTTIDPVCGDTSHYGPYGVITSPNYPLPYSRNLDCNYYVYASTGSSLSFIFKFLDVEEIHDTVTISCPANSSFPPQTFYGKSLPDPISFPWCSLGLVNFRSDDSTVARGFILNYYVSDGGCGNTLYTNSTGYVMSPNWPIDYGNNQSCLNIIWAPQRSTFSFYFLFFYLHSCCNCDQLEIICLDNSQYGPYSYCGAYAYSNLYIYGCSQMLLWFRSDFALTSPGFNIQYNVNLDGETSGETGTTELPPTTPTPPVGCGYLNYNGSSGVITSPNYPGDYDNSLKCQYFIYASTGSSIAIIFEHFDVQEDKDYLAVSCETNSSFPEQRYSGHTLPQPISIQWCSQGSLYFFTDISTVYSGYSIDYYVSQGGCGNTVYTGSAGNVTSPNYPSDYDSNLDCYNIITAPQPSHFYLEYLDFNVQGSEPCSLDWVEVTCLDNNPSNKHRFCGSTNYHVDLYQCTQVLVWFHTDVITIYQGFVLEYNVYPESGCGETSFYGPSGNISSPNYPGLYTNRIYCDYSIDTESPSGSIAIIFKDFNTEQCCDYVTVSCTTNSSYPPVIYSGHSLPLPLSIPWCSQGNINFGTDMSIVSPGFTLDYHVSRGGCGNTVYAEPQGYVSSPNYPNNYGTNQNCSNIIWSPKAITFTVNFLQFNTEECCDFVELSCLDNAEYGTHKFSGTTLPPTQTIPLCAQVLVWFFSDATTSFVGFNLEYIPSPD